MKKSAGIPIFIIAALLPLVFCFHIETIDFSKYPWFPNQDYWIDLFLYGKSSLLQIVSLFMAGILLISKIRKRDFPVNLETILLAILALFLILSTVFSKYPEESFGGSIEQYESVWVLLSYLILTVYCSKYVADVKNATLVSKALLIGLSVSCIIGLFQLFQCDIWESEFGKKLLIPETFANLRESLRFSEDSSGFGRVYMALYNSTYAGIYIVMLLPFLFLLKNRFVKILLIPAVLCLLGTMSKTAWLAAGCIGMLGFWMTSKPEVSKKIKKKWIITGSVATIIGIFVLIAIPTEDGVLTGEKKLQEIAGEEEHIRIVFQGNTVYLSEFPKDDSVTYKIVDEDGKEPDLIWVEERGEMDSLNPRFDELHFKVYLKDGIGYAVVRYEDVVFRFTDDLGTGKYEYISINGKPDKLTQAETLVDVGDSFLNGRGYIWNRVIPLIFDNLLLGTGPDTFLQIFPQDDYVARANLGYGFFSEILTNAHSLYLQLGLQNGMITLICILVLIGIYIKKSWKFYAHKECYDELDKIGLACFLGSMGYLICGITFASSVCTTPIFVILVGMGIGIQNIERPSA